MKKILIVDDEPIMLKIVKWALKDHYETIQASSGEDGIRLFVSERPDMVLSDLKMPTMSGYELYENIQEASESPIPFIFMTADESDDNESRGLEQGAADYIHKPINAEVLLKRVERVFANLEENSRLKKMAHSDAMTGLLNKFATENVIAERIKKSYGTFAVVDLDSFKLVNDLYGHRMGDWILVRFAELIRSVVRDDDIVGRIGGDEFVIFFDRMSDVEVLRKKAALLNDEIARSAKEYIGEDMSIPLGCSVGATYVSDYYAEYETVFQMADSALYRVKQGDKHGFAMYEDHTRGLEDAHGGFSEIRTLFGERGPLKGAYITDKDSFKSIFRFLVRLTSNYAWHIEMVMFTFESEDEEKVPEACDRFIEIASANLRNSDVLLKYGMDRILLLLMKSQEERYKVPIDRIGKQWANGGVAGVELSVQMESLKKEEDLHAHFVDSLSREQIEEEKGKLPEWILHEPSIDIEEGLKNCVNADNYLSSLEIFTRHVDANITELSECLRKGDFDTYTVRTHGLKSTARIIGAMQLSMFSAAMERAGNNGGEEYIRREHKAFLEEYKKLGNLLSENVFRGEKEIISEEDLSDVYLAMLEYALAEDYTLLEITMDSLNKYELLSDDAGRIAKIKKCLMKLDYEGILAVLNSRGEKR